MEELRLYSFGNMYLGGIQAGIQCQHTTAELFLKYPRPDEWDFPECTPIQVKLLREWGQDHKTTVLLNGGIAEGLEELKAFLSGNSYTKGENRLPWAYFNESQEALGGCITNIVIIVPERVYNADTFAPETTYMQYVIFCDKYNIEKLSEFEFELNKRIKSCRLMN